MTQDQKTASIELKANSTTGYTWICAISPELVFSYLREWETGVPPLKTVIYKAIVNNNNSKNWQPGG